MKKENEKTNIEVAEVVNQVEKVLSKKEEKKAKKAKKQEKVEAKEKENTTSKKEEKKAKKNKKSKEKEVINEVKAQNKVNLVEEVISKREVKYKYPDDCTDTLSRKKFRQQVRNKLHQLELEMYRIQDKQSKQFQEKEKEYKAYKKQYVKEGAAA